MCKSLLPQIQVLGVEGAKDHVKAMAVYSHPPEIWSMSASPSNASNFATAHRQGMHIVQTVGNGILAAIIIVQLM